MFSFAKHVK